MVQSFPICSQHRVEDVIDGKAEDKNDTSPTQGQLRTDCARIPNGSIPTHERTVDLLDGIENGNSSSGIISHSSPRFPKYASPSAREATYERGWPRSSPVKPVDLVKAGLFFDGTADRTVCFQCGGGLCAWEEGDDPMMEHARWYPDCPYIRLHLGQEEVQQISKEQEAVLAQAAGTVLGNDSNFDDETIESIVNASISEDDIQYYARFNISREVLKAAVRKILIETGSTPDNLRDSKELLESALSQTLSFKKRRNPQEGSTSEVTEEIGQSSQTSSENSGNHNSSDVNICIVCLAEERSVVFLPCGHLATCVNCGFQIDTCPVCRKAITGRLKAYLS